MLEKALALIADGFYPECRELLEPLQARFGNEPGYQNIFAMALYRLNEHEAAAEHYLAAIKLDPMDATPYVGIGKCLIKNLQDEEAEKYLKLGLLLDPQHAEALMGLGLIYINRQNYTEGESYFLRALEQFPEDPGVGRKVKMSHFAQSKFEPLVRKVVPFCAGADDAHKGTVDADPCIQGARPLAAGDFPSAGVVP